MAQAGYTPIQLYYSTTAAATPTAGNLNSGELAINITDGKLFYKDNGGVVQVIATKDAVTNVASISFGSTGLTPSIATTGAVTVAGTLAVGSGGTGITSGTSGGIPYFSGTSTIASSAALAANALVIGGGAGVAPSTTTTGTGVVTAIGININTSGGLVTQSGTLTSSALLLGGGSGAAITSTTTGTGVVTAVGNPVNTSGGLVTQSGTLTSSALLLGGGSGSAITSTTTGTGVVTALGNNVNATGGVATTNGTATLTNKRVTPRVSTTTSSATPTINTDNVDQFGLTAQTVDITSFTTNLSGTPTDGQKLWIYIVGTAARAITWGASFEASTVALPTTTVTTNRLDVGFVWNAATSKWRCVAVA